MSVAAVESYLQIAECSLVAAIALLTFDYCLTFGQEIEWVYGTRWTAARIHFTGSRYLPFVALAVSISTSRSAKSYCGSLAKAINALYYLCVILAEVMLIVRTHAFWKRDRKILTGMCTFGVVCMVVAIVVSETASGPTDSVYKALNCVGLDSTMGTAIQYICLIIYEMGMLGLNWTAFQRMKRQNPPSRFVTTLYCDGVMYVAAIMVFSVINAVVTLATPIQYSDILNCPQVAMHSVLASRIFFNLRETTRRDQRNTLSLIPLSDFHAQPRGSSGFSSALGNSSSSSGIDPGKTVDLMNGSLS